MKKELGVIYLAGGCFWGMEKLMKSIPGVVSAVSGYANGREDIVPTYELVCTGRTGYRETVQVEFDPEKVSLDRLLFAFFAVIDPTVENRQGHDIGSQYQTGIYYADEASGETVRRIAAVEKERYRKFAVEIGPLECFYEAEDYHQKYLDRHPDGYCHIPRTSIRKLAEGSVDPGLYRRPDEEELRGRLTPEQFRVTREAGTERPFFNEFWRTGERGIYVDIVTGEPLFSSRDKYESSCGWPSFSAGLDDAALVELPDDSHFMHRTEVRSRAGNSHLGHVFQDDGESPNGVRYCINSAALRFIPYERMEQEGYGYLMGAV